MQNSFYLEATYEVNVFKKRKYKKILNKTEKIAGGKTLLWVKLSKRNGMKILGCTGKRLTFSAELYQYVFKNDTRFRNTVTVVKRLLWPFTFNQMKGVLGKL